MKNSGLGELRMQCFLSLNSDSVPKIYIDAIWDGHQVDVLAINPAMASEMSMPFSSSRGNTSAMDYWI